MLDGRNRYLACEIAGVKPRFIEFQGDDPIGWVVTQNLVRRHLTASQKAVVAFDLLPMLERKPKNVSESRTATEEGRLVQKYANRNGMAKQLKRRPGSQSRAVDTSKWSNRSTGNTGIGRTDSYRRGERSEAKRWQRYGGQKAAERKAKRKRQEAILDDNWRAEDR